jgi:hypothetical protein
LLQNLDEFHSEMSKANTLESEQYISDAIVFKGFGYDQCVEDVAKQPSDILSLLLRKSPKV